ncbi:MAG: hypothetical protein PHU54_07140 [Candidatus Omnitrophica bacterium]|nr:hypothetical protein [Candidatus Omnitrophota bacterium]
MRCPHCGKNIAIPEKAAPLLDDSQMRAANAHEADWITRRLDTAERAVLVLQNDAADRAKQITDLRLAIKQLLASIALLEEATRGK